MEDVVGMTKKTFSDALFCFVQNFTQKQADACNQYWTPWKLPFIPLYIYPSPFQVVEVSRSA
jgi:hypothetical protein